VSKHLFDNDEIDDSLAHFSIPLTERRVMVNKSTMGELFFVGKQQILGFPTRG